MAEAIKIPGWSLLHTDRITTEKSRDGLRNEVGAPENRILSWHLRLLQPRTWFADPRLTTRLYIGWCFKRTREKCWTAQGVVALRFPEWAPLSRAVPSWRFRKLQPGSSGILDWSLAVQRL